jgi:hypothetical protein
MKLRLPRRPWLVLAACVVLGAAGGIAGSAASSRHSTSSTTSAHALARMGGFRGAGFDRAVHVEEVVLNRAGTAFITETDDNGVVKSVSGNDVTITESAGNVTYKDATITIPSGATVVRNGASASLTALKAGDHVQVRRSSDGTSVFAFDSSWRPSGGWHGGPGGPPPGAPGGQP